MTADRDNALASLYPFLYGARKDETKENAALLHSVGEKAAHSIATKQVFFEANKGRIVATARAIADVYRRQGRMFAMGNGGSSCDAAHFAVEFHAPGHRRAPGALSSQSDRRCRDDECGRQ